ncbi:FecR family protein [Niabella beijingensis]|uniref:FecR family protein n=1 Tax=Niabella beijingensis TaxID=2872700 RepID=UPI001CC06E0A|nr:FecR domain-containing protein [Niabella beijingensis]MBZ4191410.1 FecR domain-containing protein [Niabella beijingensis]
MEYNINEIKSLMIARLNNSIDPDDDLFLQQLIEQQKDIGKLWDELRQFFQKEESQQFLRNINTEAEWEQLQQRIRTRKKSALVRWLPYTAAAAILLFIFVKFVFVSTPHPDRSGQTAGTRASKKILMEFDNGETVNLSDQKNGRVTASGTALDIRENGLQISGGASQQWSKITVPPGLDYQVRLPDNTTVWLNAASSLRFPVKFEAGLREIEIEGEAYLEVAKDAARPFVVHTGGATIQVLGTEFNVNSYHPGSLRVALVTGKVSLRSPKETLELKPGFEATLSNGSGFRIAAFDERQVLSWMKGRYIFSNLPVSEIADILQRCYDIPVAFDNNTVKDKRFTGLIDKKKPITVFLDNLASTGDLGYYFQGSTLHFK